MAGIKLKWVGRIITRGDGMWKHQRKNWPETGQRALSIHIHRYQKSTINSVNEKYLPVADFYAGKSVFLTGGTGFLGKAFIERLLSSCPQIDKIFVLIREKKKVAPEKRLEELTNDPLFNRLKIERCQDLKKITPVTGDITLPNLGISAENEKTLIDKVSVVIHSAATVKFLEPLSIALKINYEGTKKVMELSQRIKNIESFVYVSTSFCNTDKKVLQETVYPPPMKIEDVYKFLDLYGDNVEMTRKLLNRRPNTYTFTKALTENYVLENHGKVPSIIVRPSSVSPNYNEPVGWLDNWNGFTGLVNAVAGGVLRVIPGDGTHMPDLIPVDYVSNLSIVAAARCNGSKDVTVYNCCSSSENPILWDEFANLYRQEYTKQKLNELPFPSVIFTKSKGMLALLTFLTETTPAAIGDFWLRVKGEKPKYMKLLSRANLVRDILYHFTYNNWVMRADHVRALSASLSPSDQKRFPFDPTSIDWSKYIPRYCQGVKHYLENKK